MARRCPDLLFLFISLSCWASLNALELVALNKKSFEGIHGGKIILDCKYTIAPEDIGTLDIEWFLVAADSQQADQMIINYNRDVVYHHTGPLKDRVQFASNDPREGDGSIEIINLQESDTGTYQCKVKKLPGSKNMKMPLTVYTMPGKTRCFIEGKQEIGNDLALKCNTKEGSAPLAYSWQKITGMEKLPPTATADSSGSVLSVKNASQEFSGTYRCTSRNRVGTDECLVILNVVPPANTAGIIAGAIIGTLLFLIILGILIFCCCRKQKEKKYEKEIQHEIREDVAPPKSRTSTARSYIGSNHSSLGSLSPSNMDGYSKAQYNQVPREEHERVLREEHERVPSHNPSFTAPKVAGPNLSRMGAIAVMIPAQCKDGSIV
ncbi:PREDICTED: coxsackievirus and adenovirus receptor [Nanorana parkeri]|uniref:coxsackievirus and adenovirus receptor n=1 Tax=Nanorana parkeri TaxID=125878 RepID=UPI000854827F|nr:PREDICTED: coxsackievirus and adenovirus receptor [Nanorana parkeri]